MIFSYNEQQFALDPGKYIHFSRYEEAVDCEECPVAVHKEALHSWLHLHRQRQKQGRHIWIVSNAMWKISKLWLEFCIECGGEYQIQSQQWLLDQFGKFFIAPQGIVLTCHRIRYGIQADTKKLLCSKVFAKFEPSSGLLHVNLPPTCGFWK